MACEGRNGRHHFSRVRNSFEAADGCGILEAPWQLSTAPTVAIQGEIATVGGGGLGPRVGDPEVRKLNQGKFLRKWFRCSNRA